jgi:hypothetical protein
MAGTADKPKKDERLRALLDFVFGFENRRGEILDQWLYSVEGFSYPPQDFYAAVEREMEGRKIPGMAVRREEFAEGGLLSDQRTYLRLMRERFAIVVCAAPFGSIYFFSCRVVHVPALVRLWHVLAAIAFFGAVTRLMIEPLGLTFTAIALVGLMFAIASVLRNAGSSALSDLDALLLKIPVVATFYENWFRLDTHYRLDTRTLYVKLLPALVKESAAGICAEKGVKLVRQLESPSVPDELYRGTPPQGETPRSADRD